MMQTLRIFAASRRLRASALAMFFMGMLAASLAPYQGLVAIKWFGFSDAQFALIMVVGSFVSVVVSLYVGILTDQRASRRTTALRSGVISTFGLGIVYATGAPWAYLLAAMLLIPVGFSLFGQLFAIARLSVEERAPQERDGVMAYFRAIFAVPFIVILPLWSLAFARGMELITLYAATTFASLLCLGSLWLFLPKDGTEGGAEKKSGLSFRQSMAELAQPTVITRLMLIATLVAANTTYMQTMGLIFDEAHENGTARTANFAALIAGLEVPFMLMLPMVTRRLPKSTVFLAAGVIYAVFLLTFPRLAGTDLVWLTALPAAMGAAILLSLPIAYFQDLLSDRPGASSALMSVNQVTSQIIAGSIFWIGTSVASYGLVMTLGAVAAILAGLTLQFADAARNRY